MEYKFNENTRVQVPAALHLCRLGYTYLDNITEYDSKTNILTDVFLRSVQRQISCNIQNDKKLHVNANIYSI